MIKNTLSSLLDFNFFLMIIFLFALYILIIFIWPLLTKNFHNVGNYEAIQRIHSGEIPRLGGFISFLALSLYCFFNIIRDGHTNNFFIESVLISALPIIIVSLKEDVFHNTSPSLRLFAMFLSCICFFYLYPISYPEIDMPYLKEILIKSPFLTTIFYSLCVMLVMNGSNMIDGSNGLLAITAILQCLCLIFFCTVNLDLENLNILLIFTPILLVFLIFNYPYGKVFMGDTGAYFIGFFIALITIKIFGNNPDIPTWNAMLILLYPAFELIFSIIRKLLIGRNPFEPDCNHLHLKMHNLLQSKISNIVVSNSMVMPCITLIWGMPFVMFVWVYDSLLLSIFSILFYILIYMAFYHQIPHVRDRKSSGKNKS